MTGAITKVEGCSTRTAPQIGSVAQSSGQTPASIFKVAVRSTPRGIVIPWKVPSVDDGGSVVQLFYKGKKLDTVEVIEDILDSNICSVDIFLELSTKVVIFSTLSQAISSIATISMGVPHCATVDDLHEEWRFYSQRGLQVTRSVHYSHSFAPAGNTIRRVVAAAGFDTNDRNMRALNFDSIESELSHEEFTKDWRTGAFEVRTFQESQGMTGLRGFNDKVGFFRITYT